MTNPKPIMMGFYCLAPSCCYLAEAGTQYCAGHNGSKPQVWYEVRSANGKYINVRASSQAAAEAAVAK